MKQVRQNITENLNNRIWIIIINKEGDLLVIEFLFAINAFVCFLDAIDHKDKENIEPKQPQNQNKKQLKKHRKTLKVKVVKK